MNGEEETAAGLCPAALQKRKKPSGETWLNWLYLLWRWNGLPVLGISEPHQLIKYFQSDWLLKFVL